jgi:hypothetical protein
MFESKASVYESAPCQETLRTLGGTAPLIPNPGSVDVNAQLQVHSLCAHSEGL